MPASLENDRGRFSTVRIGRRDGMLKKRLHRDGDDAMRSASPGEMDPACK